MSYFAIEYDQQYQDHVAIKDNDGNVMFDNYLNMTYDEMKSAEDLEELVTAVIDIAKTDQAIITLIGDDDVFIWSIIIGTDDDDVRYVLVDWKKGGKVYKYED